MSKNQTKTYSHFRLPRLDRVRIVLGLEELLDEDLFLLVHDGDLLLDVLDDKARLVGDEGALGLPLANQELVPLYVKLAADLEMVLHDIDRGLWCGIEITS